MGVIAKMRCSGVNTYDGYYMQKPVIAGEIILKTVYSDDPRCKDKSFTDATPSGELRLHINNPEALKQFEPRKEYFVTIEEAPEDAV